MDFNVTLLTTKALYDQEYSCFKFPGGEVHVRLHEPPKIQGNLIDIIISGDIYNSDILMELMLLKNCLDRQYSSNTRKSLSLKYLPYARQDRVCTPGDSFSLEVMADLLNLMRFDKVRVWDAHNEGAASILIRNLEIESQASIIHMQKCLGQLPNLNNILIVAPDKGASKKIREVCDKLNQPGFLQGEKIRDPATGQLTGFDVNCKDFLGKDVLIVDDICDGGGTFIGLAEVIRKRNCGKLYLYVTHGIFSKGKHELNRYFDGIYTPYTFKGNFNV